MHYSKYDIARTLIKDKNQIVSICILIYDIRSSFTLPSYASSVLASTNIHNLRNNLQKVLCLVK